MNRRTFVAGVPALFPAVALSQEATPQAAPADSTLARLIQALFVDRSFADIAALISPTTSDQDGMILVCAELMGWVSDTFGDESPALTIKMIASESDREISLIDLGDPREAYVFLYIQRDDQGVTGMRYSRALF